MEIKVLILTGYGINAEKELAWAFELAGGAPDIVHLEDVIENKKLLDKYRILAFPGGFSFGDHISSGRVYANMVKNNLIDELRSFIDSDKLVIGICNGFQIITKLGIVPDLDKNQKQSVSLIQNDSGHFEDRWVWLKVQTNKCPWLYNIDTIYLPVRHGEGKFVVENDILLNRLKENDQIALKYYNPNSKDVTYPFNPNGSIEDIAGIINTKGNVFGLMPHPEAYIFNENHPRWTEKVISDKYIGLDIFKNGINYFR